jgi:hypothetical protein
MSGVELSSDHVPRQCNGSRIGIIRYVAYVSDVDTLGRTLVARVQVFRELEEIGPHGQILVDPRRMMRQVFFVRLQDVGCAVAFVPTRAKGDGATNIHITKNLLWNRPQYVVSCNPHE